MSSKPLPKETDAIEKEVKNLWYLRKFCEEITRISEDMNIEDPLSVSYANVKLHTWLKNMLLYMIKHHVIDHTLHEVLRGKIESIENDLDFWKIVAQKTSENRGELLAILIGRETYAQLGRIMKYYRILLILSKMRAKELETELTEIAKFQKLGEKLREQLQNLEEESKKKVSKYVA